MTRRNGIPLVVLAASLAMTGGIAGCAGTPEPVAEMASARTALRNVQSTDAQELAPVELDRARSKFQRAEAAYAEEEYDEARRLAQESLADAELAAAKANAIVAKRSAEELEQSISVLRQEIQRARSGM